MVDRTDNFNRAGPGLGANWTQSANFTAAGHDINIFSSTVVGGTTVNVDHAAYWSADTFNGDQNSQVVLSTAANDGGPVVRHQSGASTFYLIDNGGGTTYIYYECTAGSFAALGANITATALANGQILKLTIAGSTLTANENGTDLTTRSDSSITGGNPGVHCFSNAIKWDNWQGGPITVTAPPPFTTRINNMLTLAWGD